MESFDILLDMVYSKLLLKFTKFTKLSDCHALSNVLFAFHVFVTNNTRSHQKNFFS